MNSMTKLDDSPPSPWPTRWLLVPSSQQTPLSPCRQPLPTRPSSSSSSSSFPPSPPRGASLGSYDNKGRQSAEQKLMEWNPLAKSSTALALVDP